MDYRAWINKVRSFSESLRTLPGTIYARVEIEPPIAARELEKIAEKWSGKLPRELTRFWTEGASRIDCSYAWSPPANKLPMLNEIFEYERELGGGVRFDPPHQIYPGNSGARPDDDLIAQTLGTEGRELWCRCAVFLQCGNGDCLGLDPLRSPEDPAVVYLLHDGDDSTRISPTFTEFLQKWAELCFIGPEHWLLDYWLDRRLGTLDLAQHKTVELRKLLLPSEE